MLLARSTRFADRKDMPDSQLPSTLLRPGEVAPSQYAPPAPMAPLAPEGGADGGLPWGRYVAALRRFKWLIIALTLLGGGAGFAATRMMSAVYEVQATIWITGGGSDRGPIRPDEMLSAASWIELFTSGAVLDPVVQKLTLYLNPAAQSDWPAFAGFAAREGFRAGTYDLTIDHEAGRFTLSNIDGTVIEEGALGDSIGRSVGFQWRPPAGQFEDRQSMRFLLTSPREASIILLNNVRLVQPRTQEQRAGNLLRVVLTGENPRLTATILNAWVREFLAAAARLKKRNLVELARVLEEQLRYAKTQLGDAEMALESFRVSTITQPSEGTPVAAGVELTRDPVFTNFFSQKLEQDEVRRDREALERIVASSVNGRIAPEAFFSLPTLLEAAPNLRTTLQDLATKEAQLRSAQQVYTDEHATVRELRASIDVLATNTIPSLAADLLAQLRLREEDLDRRISSASRELQAIPTRTIEEMRLRRQVVVQENLYTTLQTRFEEARLAEASAVPDVQPLDTAVAPQRPMTDQTARILMLAIIASLGAAIGLALLLDRVDKRLRYPDQITNDLGLHILGAVPSIGVSKNGATDLETATQVVEAFRTVRLGLTHALNDARPLMLTISSPNLGDGKSLISSNLALSFAEGGYRTLLIDGDIRRGGLHRTFEIERRPGLVDCLMGDATVDEVVHPANHANLSVIPGGVRRQRGPELLASRALTDLLAQLKPGYDAIIIDSPPLGAGIDPFALGVATGSMMLVVRPGETDRKLAMAKLTLLDRLPVKLVGAVLNAFKSSGEYRHYSYDYGYASEVEDDHRLPSGV